MTGSGSAPVEWLLTSGAACPQGVQADPADDGNEPAAQVLDVVRGGPAHPQPGVLDSIGRGKRTEHPIGERPKPRSLLLEVTCSLSSIGSIFVGYVP